MTGFEPACDGDLLAPSKAQYQTGATPATVHATLRHDQVFLKKLFFWDNLFMLDSSDIEIHEKGCLFEDEEKSNFHPVGCWWYANCVCGNTV